jgi:DNA polymerase/3'-5' exonuclease PolX
MSTGTRRTYAEAIKSAEAFRALFPATCYEQWEIAGSIRRRKMDVGDVEHVVIPRFGAVIVSTGLFTETKTINLLCARMEELVAAGTIAKHIYGGSGPRWGEKYRGSEFGGMLHEVFMADARNFGSVLLIRTGPAEFSERIVTIFKDGGMLRQQEGYLRYTASGEVVPVPDEATYLRLAGLSYISPENRV